MPREAKKRRLEGGRKKEHKEEANQTVGERVNTKGRTGGNRTTKQQKLTRDKGEEETTNCGKRV